MLRFVFLFTFIVSIASAAFGFLLSNDLRKKNQDAPVYTSILYQQILIYVFALYGIWGHVFSKLIFSTELLSVSLIEKISTLNTLLAIPFLLFSWWFLLSIFFDLSGNSKASQKATLSLIISLLILIISFLFLTKSVSVFEAFKQLFFIENMVVCVLVSTLTLFLNKKLIKRKRRILLSGGILLIGTIISVGALYYSINSWVTIAYIFFFFIANTWLPFSFRFLIQPMLITKEIEPSFVAFCEKYEISKREAEIIEEISRGLSNKEIAEKLFITLQTVKDHTSRIYLKTEVRNRTQLANLVREVGEK